MTYAATAALGCRSSAARQPKSLNAKTPSGSLRMASITVWLYSAPCLILML
jgi:hypothetical protein